MLTQLTAAAVYVPLLDFAGVCLIEDSAHESQTCVTGIHL